MYRISTVHRKLSLFKILMNQINKYLITPHCALLDVVLIRFSKIYLSIVSYYEIYRQG